MDFQLLKYFIAVAETGGISKASEKLYISEPSLSRNIKAVERQVGHPLFTRHHSGMSLTQIGSRYLKFARAVIQMEGETMEEIQLIANTASRKSISVGISSMWSSILMPKILPVFYSDCEQGKLDIFNETSFVLEQMLLDGKLDTAVITAPLDRELNRKLEYVKLFEEPILVAISTKSPLCDWIEKREGEPFDYIAPEHLVNQPFILSNPNHRLYDSADLFFRAEKISPRVIMREDFVHVAKQMAAENLGLAFINESVTRIYAVDSDKIIYCRTAPSLRGWDVVLAWKNDPQIRSYVKPFVDAARKAASH